MSRRPDLVSGTDSADDDADADALGTATFLFDPENIAITTRPPEDSARLVWMFLSLLRRREIGFDRYYKIFSRSEKTFGRDVAKLRELGRRFGFALSDGPLKRKRGATARAFLVALDELPEQRKADAKRADTLRAVSDALGAVVANDVAKYVDVSSAFPDPFLRLAVPALIAEQRVGELYDVMRRAWMKRARVRFRYPKRGDGGLEEREVEPHLVTYYDGRYYLVAYDRRPRTQAWRQFALDRITGDVKERGTFAIRPVPPHYRGEDAVGLFKSSGVRDVSVALSPRIASAVVARRWQRAQRVQTASDGSATITFAVYDFGEAVRWAFGFGGEARVVDPPEAARLADNLLERMRDANASQSERRSETA
jgi:predicted DNA-binding transcriptional regulator YafY